MSAEVKEEVELEIGQVSFVDIVDYSKLSSAAKELNIVLAMEGTGRQTSGYETPFNFCLGIVCCGAPVLRGNSQPIGGFRSQR
jgi:hypothetical protein